MKLPIKPFRAVGCPVFTMEQTSDSAGFQGFIDFRETRDNQACLVGDGQGFEYPLQHQCVDTLGEIDGRGDVALQTFGEDVAADRLLDVRARQADPDAATGKAHSKIRHDNAIEACTKADQVLDVVLRSRHRAQPHRAGELWLIGCLACWGGLWIGCLRQRDVL